MDAKYTLSWEQRLSLVFVFLFASMSSGFTQEATNSSVSPSLMPANSSILASNTFIFNPKKLNWMAIGSNGKVIRSGKASGGSHYCRDIRRSCQTPTGTYSIIGKRGADCRSTRYPVGRGGAKMPYCMFFTKYYAIHGSYDVPNYNASHGCIRVRPGDAKWLHQNFIKIGTTVVVKPY